MNEIVIRMIHTWIYQGARQEGKADILFYLENDEMKKTG